MEALAGFELVIDMELVDSRANVRTRVKVRVSVMGLPNEEEVPPFM